ncbi:AsmA family protein [Pseudoxanthomonas sp. 10H]|uniref:hypothetical protein n=1 Tax=Pseudoxanthomonas sp. 10H TaxID=3242729 RepID=UPI00355603DD
MEARTWTSGTAREAVRRRWAGWLAFWRGRPRWLRRAAWALLVAYGFYLLLGNLFLNTPLGPWAANRTPEKFQAQWGPAFTLYPGHVVARDVRLQGQVRHLYWDVQAQRVRGRLALWPLLGKEIRVPAIVASGVTGGARHVERNREPPPPREGGWTLLFDRIAADHVLRGHFDELVLEGDGTAVFGFSKQLRGGPMQILPSSVHFDSARLLADGDELLDGVRLDGTFSMKRHTRAQAPGMRKLLLTDGTVSIDGEGSSLRGYVDPQGRFQVATIPGGGQLHARLEMRDGVLQPGGTLSWTAPMHGVGITGAPLGGEMQVRASVDDDIALRLQVPRREGGILDLDAELRLPGRELPTGGGLPAVLQRASGHVVGHWHFPSLAWVPAMFNAPAWLQLDGSGELVADLRMEAGRPAPGSHVELPEVAVAAVVMDNHIRGHGRVRADLVAGDGGPLQSRLSVQLDDYAIAGGSTAAVPYAKGNDLQLDVVVEGRPMQGQALGATSAHLRFSGAQVPDLRVYNRFLSEQMRIEGGSGTASADLRLDGVGNIGHGTVSVQGHGARMSMGGRQLKGDVALDAQLRRADLAQRQFVLDGSQVRLRNVSFRAADGQARQGWWANIDMPGARIDLAAPNSVSGTVEVAARDVGFLVDLFGSGHGYPRWMDRLVDSGQARARARVHWQGDALVLDSVHASNERYEVQARLRMEGQERHGQLLARMGVLSAGMELRNGRRDMHLVRAREWFDAQPAMLH